MAQGNTLNLYNLMLVLFLFLWIYLQLNLRSAKFATQSPPLYRYIWAAQKKTIIQSRTSDSLGLYFLNFVKCIWMNSTICLCRLIWYTLISFILYMWIVVSSIYSTWILKYIHTYLAFFDQSLPWVLLPLHIFFFKWTFTLFESE